MALSSKKLYFRYNNTTYNLPLFTAQHSPFTIKVSDGSNTYHALTDGGGGSSYTENNIKYFYSSAKPSIHAISGAGTTCNAYNASEQLIVYDIPAGTYTPSAFENLIIQYISANGSRTCANAFTAKVNGHTYNVSAGQAIKYCTTNTDGSGTNSTLRIVTFNGRTYAEAQDANLLVFRGTYVVHASNFSGYAQFSAYANYSITIETGIRFY